MSQGESLKLIDLVCRKLQNRKTLETIAEELEESLEKVEQIRIAVGECRPEADTMEIYKQL